MKTLLDVILIILFIFLIDSCARQQQEEQKTSQDTTIRTAPSTAAETAGSPALSRSEMPEHAAADTVIGEVYVAGNEPFKRLMLSLGPSKSINLEADTSMIKSLWKIQGMRIKVIGIIKKSMVGDAIVIEDYHVIE